MLFKEKKAVSMMLIVSLIVTLFSGMFTVSPVQANTEAQVVLVGDLQSELGHTGDWDPAAEATRMTHVGNGFYELSGTLPAGSYEYKVAIGGGWDENYGAGGAPSGANISLTLAEETRVTFYYNHHTHKIANSTHYTPIAQSSLPRLVGNIQTAIGDEADWAPDKAQAILLDDDFDKNYTVKVKVPKGNYEYKITLGPSWDVNYGANGAPGGDNLTLNVIADEFITFTYNHDSNMITTDYKVGGSDGLVDAGKLYHNTWDSLYRQPFGAIAANESVTLRLQAKKDDLTRVRLVLRNYDTGSSKVYNMDYAGWAEHDTAGSVELWEVTVTPTEKGVYGYKFIAGDQSTQREYGEDEKQGEVGRAEEKNAKMFQLTVHDPAFETPDWMKEAVVYQIFPDRFFNGNTENDVAKSKARGQEPIERKKWNELPDNPRMSNDPDYDGDAIWSNDFFGGDIEGIRQKLDYIQSLGVNTLYLNPINHAASNHKYDATDFKAVDPMFASPEEFKTFADELKARDMYLILDGVFNHVGDDSIYFDRYGKYETVGAYEYWSRVYDKMNESGKTEEEARAEADAEFVAEGQIFSPYGFHLWFNIENEKVDIGKSTERYSYQAWWGFDSLPEIKSVPGNKVKHNSELNNEPFANYIFYEEDSVAKSWITRGGSGWRLDVANEVDVEFWKEFRKEIKGKTINAEGEKPLILGEIWDDASKYFLGDQYDSVMNYRFRGAVIDFLKSGRAKQADEQLKAIHEDYPAEAFYALMNLMGSHDTARAVFILGNGTDSSERAELDPNYNHELGLARLKLAAIFQMGYPGAPTIYYADEAGTTGSHDPDDRRVYPWGAENTSLIEHYKKVGKVRTDNKNLFAYGDINTLHAEGDVYAYARKLGNEFAIVAMNRGNESKTVELNMNGLLTNGIAFTDQLDTAYKVTSAGNKVSITIPAMTGRMLVADAGQSLALPNDVTGLVGQEGTGSVTLSWTGHSDATEYKVYQSTIADGLYKEVATTSETSIKVDGLNNGRKYFFMVKAIDDNGNASKGIKTEALIPHYSLSAHGVWTGNLSVLEAAEIDLTVDREVFGELYIQDVTNAGVAEGVMARLMIQYEGDSGWEVYPAEYVGQNGDNNKFKASFIPLEAGNYSYKMSFSSDLGRTWRDTESIGTVTYTKNAEDTTPPAESVTLVEPTQESGQVNLEWSLVGADSPIMYAILRDGEIIDFIWNEGATQYTDFDVSNGTTYTYQVRVYDRYGNYTDSNSVKVTPDLVMVEVTFKVNAPDYTPLDSVVSIPGSLNGWNTGAWKMSRNGAVTPDWEYTIELQDGEEFTYKYVKNESWDQEGLADHTPGNPTDDDVSYYGYGAVGTDLKIIVQNQGNNKMVVQDKILRWIDMPVVIKSPVQNATVNTNTVKVEGNAIKGGSLKINNQAVTINPDMTFAHDVALTSGRNEIKVQITPSDTVKEEIFKGDGGAIGKNTKEYTLVVNSTAQGSTGGSGGSGGTGGSGTPNTPGAGSGNGSGNGTGSTNTPPVVTLPKADIKVENGVAKVKVNEQKAKEAIENAGSKAVVQFKAEVEAGQPAVFTLPATVITQAINKDISISFRTNSATVTLPSKNLTAGVGQFTESVQVEVKPAAKEEGSKAVDQATKKDSAFKSVNKVVSFSVVVSEEGKERKISKFVEPVTVTISLSKEEVKEMNPDYAGVYYLADGSYEFMGGEFTDEGVTFQTPHFSTFAVLEYRKTFADVSDKSWAKEAIEKLAAKHIIKGIDEEKFGPDLQVTRAQFATILSRALGLTPAEYSAVFADVSANQYYTPHVLKMAELGIVQGSNGKFRPHDSITREEMAVMIMNAYHYKHKDSSVSAEGATFKDMKEVSAWAKKAVKEAKSLGIVNGSGDDLFTPKNKATRAETAKMVLKLVEIN